MTNFKDDFISKHGEEAYEKILEQNRAYYKAHKVQVNARAKNWRETHPEEVKATFQEVSRKGGKRYNKQLAYSQTGILSEKRRIRANHTLQYKPYKAIIAPDSQIHHQWRPETAEYDGVALVEKDQHMHGFIDVIQILEGEITLFREGER